MFALEINFHDGVSPSEVIFVRRALAVVGGSDYAHVVIEGGSQQLSEIRLARGVGREFAVSSLRRPDNGAVRPRFVEGTYTLTSELDLGGVSVQVTSLDLDLQLRANESPDKAGVRVLRRAVSHPSPMFPAVAVLGPAPFFVSFSPDEPLVVGRSRQCGLRMDLSEISSEHCRIGAEATGGFWVEDLGSTNGTYIGSVRGERVSGRRTINGPELIALGTDVSLAIVRNREELAALHLEGTVEETPIVREQFPCVVGNSDLFKPNRYALVPGARVTIGRDPASDIWISAAHISRVHAEVRLRDDGRLEVTDLSSNGTFNQGRKLPREVPVELPSDLTVLDLGAGVKVGLCFNEEQEANYRREHFPSQPVTPAVETPAPMAAVETSSRLDETSEHPVYAEPFESAGEFSEPERVPDFVSKLVGIETQPHDVVGKETAINDRPSRQMFGTRSESFEPPAPPSSSFYSGSPVRTPSVELERTSGTDEFTALSAYGVTPREAERPEVQELDFGEAAQEGATYGVPLSGRLGNLVFYISVTVLVVLILLISSGRL